jgi:hypothetical protein
MVYCKQDSGFYDLGQCHYGGSNFVNFDINIHIGRDGLVCSETNMYEKIFFLFHIWNYHKCMMCCFSDPCSYDLVQGHCLDLNFSIFMLHTYKWWLLCLLCNFHIHESFKFYLKTYKVTIDGQCVVNKTQVSLS